MIMEREKVPPRVFAETIGVQQSTLSHILNDRNKPSLEVVMKVHQTYNYGYYMEEVKCWLLLKNLHWFPLMVIINLLCLMRIL